MRDLAAADRVVYGYNKSASGARTAAREGFDVSNDLDATLQRANNDSALIVIAVPMGAVGFVLDEIVAKVPNCGITDVVSVKTPVYRAIKERGLQDRYVGSHPMAGTEESGWSASKTGLFVRCAWVITYDYAAECEAAGQSVPADWLRLFIDVNRMIMTARAETVPSQVRAHDEAVARVSHLPHVIAEALALVGDNGGVIAQSLAASSFKDATRVAGTAPELVRAMCESNAPALVDIIDEFIGRLQDARESLSGPEPSIKEFAENGHIARTRLVARSGARRGSVSPVKISSRPVLRFHPGGNNWLAQLKQAEDIGARIEIF